MKEKVTANDRKRVRHLAKTLGVGGAAGVLGTNHHEILDILCGVKFSSKYRYNLAHKLDKVFSAEK